MMTEYAKQSGGPMHMRARGEVIIGNLPNHGVRTVLPFAGAESKIAARSTLLLTRGSHLSDTAAGSTGTEGGAAVIMAGPASAAFATAESMPQALPLAATSAPRPTDFPAALVVPTALLASDPHGQAFGSPMEPALTTSQLLSTGGSCAAQPPSHVNLLLHSTEITLPESAASHGNSPFSPPQVKCVCNQHRSLLIFWA